MYHLMSYDRTTVARANDPPAISMVKNVQLDTYHPHISMTRERFYAPGTSSITMYDYARCVLPKQHPADDAE